MTVDSLILTRLRDPDWSMLDALPDRSIHQTKAWMDFVVAAQQAKPVVAEVKRDNQAVGFFTGAIVNKLGFRILGSPFPGWTTSYMGFSLEPGVDHIAAVHSLRDFAFRELGCVHLELMDRKLSHAEAVATAVGAIFRSSP